MLSRITRALPLLAVLSLTWSAPGAARSLYGTVTEFKSGNEFVVRHDAGTYAVRLYGVEVPAAEPFATQARLLAKGLLADKEARIRIMTRNERDEMVSQILVDGQDVGLALMRAGLALRTPNVHYKPHVKGQPDDLVAAETEARLGKRGIWGLSQSSPRAQGADAGFELPAAVRAAGTVDTNASVKTGDDSECAIAQNPLDPLQLFQSCNSSGAGIFAARSVDGGLTWTYPDPSDKTIADGDAGQGTSACCDPTLTWDRFGNLYVNYLASSIGSVITLLSTDGGLTFTEIGSFTGSVDQPTIVSANVGADAHVWVVWNASGTMVARGAIATALGTVGAWSAQQSTAASNCSFGDIAISPAGVVVQVCENPTGGQGPGNLRFNADADGFGAGGFGAVTTATTTNVGGFDFIPAQNSRSVDAEAGLAYDHNPASPTFGRLYMVYSDEVVAEAHDLETMVRWSDNNGTTWSAPLRVNDDATTRSQFLPKIASDPATGNVTVCWHDARNSGTNTTMQIYCSTALPNLAGPSFSPNVKVSDGTSQSNGAGVEYGDYMGLAFVGGVAHPVWADTSNSTGDNPNGTSNFDAYSDLVPAGLLFQDGFEMGNTTAWSTVTP